MIDDAEARGALQKDAVIIEPTSGNTRYRACIRRGGARLPPDPSPCPKP